MAAACCHCNILTTRTTGPKNDDVMQRTRDQPGTLSLTSADSDSKRYFINMDIAQQSRSDIFGKCLWVRDIDHIKDFRKFCPVSSARYLARQ
jgi:hypothetical protein